MGGAKFFALVLLGIVFWPITPADCAGQGGRGDPYEPYLNLPLDETGISERIVTYSWDNLPFQYRIGGKVNSNGFVWDYDTLHYTATHVTQQVYVFYGDTAPWEWYVGGRQEYFSWEDEQAEVLNNGQCNYPGGVCIFPGFGEPGIPFSSQTPIDMTLAPMSGNFCWVASGLPGEGVVPVYGDWSSCWRHRPSIEDPI